MLPPPRRPDREEITRNRIRHEEKEKKKLAKKIMLAFIKSGRSPDIKECFDLAEKISNGN